MSYNLQGKSKEEVGAWLRTEISKAASAGGLAVKDGMLAEDNQLSDDQYLMGLKHAIELVEEANIAAEKTVDRKVEELQSFRVKQSENIEAGNALENEEKAVLREMISQLVFLRHTLEAASGQAELMQKASS